MSVLFWMVILGAAFFLVYLFLIITKINEADELRNLEELDSIDKLFMDETYEHGKRKETL